MDRIISLIPQETRPRGQQRGPRLTARDIYVMQWIVEHTAIRFDHLQRLLAQQSVAPERLASEMLSEHSTRRILRRWLVEGLVVYKIFLVGEKGWIWLTEWGVDYLGLEGTSQEPLPGDFARIFSQNEQWLGQNVKP